jgi:hypothetical protein
MTIQVVQCLTGETLKGARANFQQMQDVHAHTSTTENFVQVLTIDI